MMNHPQASALRRFLWPKSLMLLCILGFLPQRGHAATAYAIDTPSRELTNPGTSAASTRPAAYSTPPTWPPWLADGHSAGWRWADTRGCENGTNMHAGSTVPGSEEARFWQAPLHLVNDLDQCKTHEVYAKRIDGPSFGHLLDLPVTIAPASAIVPIHKKVRFTGLARNAQVDAEVCLQISIRALLEFTQILDRA